MSEQNRPVAAEPGIDRVFADAGRRGHRRRSRDGGRDRLRWVILASDDPRPENSALSVVSRRA